MILNYKTSVSLKVLFYFILFYFFILFILFYFILFYLTCQFKTCHSPSPMKGNYTTGSHCWQSSLRQPWFTFHSWRASKKHLLWWAKGLYCAHTHTKTTLADYLSHLIQNEGKVSKGSYAYFLKEMLTSQLYNVFWSVICSLFLSFSFSLTYIPWIYT